MLNFLVVLILLNAVFLVVAQTGGAGKTTTEPDNPGYTHPSSTPMYGLSNSVVGRRFKSHRLNTYDAINESSSLKRGRLSPGATAGIVVATVIPFILAVGIYLLYLLKRQRRPPRHGPVDLTVEPDPIGSPVCTATNVFPVPQTKNLSSQLHSSPTQRPTSWGMVSPHGVSAQSLPQSTAWVQHPSKLT
ncbi:hypothetical protein L208DRAFT_1382932 [Tricholoma matsutake]|nr:hypothetical protein L208DRAFT_1382932 [Tricholoma matsutake 945]